MLEVVATPFPSTSAISTELRRAEAADTREFIDASKSDATKRAYRSDFRIFTRWCADRNLSPVPADPESVAQFLASEARRGASPSTISRRAAAIGYAHSLAGETSPAKTAVVRTTLAGIRRKLGTAPRQKAPATAAVIVALSDIMPRDLRGLRDRAVIALGFAGAFRRSELAALTVDNLSEGPEGIRVLILKSKGDQDGKGQTVAIPRGSHIKPVAAVREWLEAAGITEGPVFRQITRHGRVLQKELTGQTIGSIVKRHAVSAGLEASDFAGHSLRAGFLTSAAENGASIFKMIEVSRHKSVETLKGYVRRAELFKDHAGKGFL